MTDLGKILILGSGGQLGTELKRVFGDYPNMEVYGRDKVDFSSMESIREIVRQVRPNIVLNAAAYTAVDRAESEPDLAMAVNGIAPRVLAEETARLDALLVHYSTDYVFDGSKAEPWVETDEPAPLNVYGHTKLEGERGIMEYGNKYLIFRTSWVFSSHGSNFMLTIRRLAKERDTLKVVDDQYGAPTSADALAKATRTALEKCYSEEMITSNWIGLYHMTCSGSTSWYGFARSILEEITGDSERKVTQVIGIATEEYPTPTSRPKNSMLSNQKLYKSFHIQLPSWQEALSQVMQKS